LLAATLLPARAAGTAEVNYIKPERFTDIGFRPWEREQALKDLSEHLGRLGRKLPDGQTLRVDVLDVDLAGEESYRGVHDTRILRGRADWPRINLRYTLLEGDRTLKTGEDQLADMNYFFYSRGTIDYQTLFYEKRLLDRWFAELVAPAQAETETAAKP
jgi:hypothetical protein